MQQIAKADEIRTFGHRWHEVTLKMHKGGKVNVRISGRVLNYDFALINVPPDVAGLMAMSFIDYSISKEPT